MPRETRSSSTLQATIEFPSRKTRSQRKKIDSKVEVGSSPRKRRDRAEGKIIDRRNFPYMILFIEI